MKSFALTLQLLLVSMLGAVVLTGCSNPSGTPTQAPATNGAADWKAGLDPGQIAGLAELGEADRSAAVAQKTCPVSGQALGAMGQPLKLNLESRDVFLCCAACEDAFRANPEEFFSKLDKS